MERLKSQIALLLILIYSSSYGQNPETSHWTKKIDDVIKNIAIENGPGGAIAVAKGEEVLYSKAFGFADIDKLRPNTVNTLFDIASCSKQFTAACILQLAREGKIDLEKPIQEYIDRFSIDTPIPVHSLLTHSSGLQDYSELLLLARGREEVALYSNKDILETILMQTDLSFAPGTSENYSNSNYALLAKLVESVSGLCFPEYLRRNIFEPLNLTSDEIYLSELDQNADFAWGYPGRMEGETKFIPEKVKFNKPEDIQIHGDGGIKANVFSLIKWMNAYTKGQVGASLLQKDSILKKDTLTNGAITEYARGGLKTGITSTGYKWVQHTGRSNSTSIMMWLPDYDVFIVALFNTQEIWAQSVTNKFYKDVINAMPRISNQDSESKLSETQNQSNPENPPFVEQPELVLSQTQLQKFVGTYPADAPVGSHVPPSGGVGVDQIVLEDNKLKYVLYNGYKINLKPINDNTLEMTGVGRPIQLRFNDLESNKPGLTVADPLVNNGEPCETIYQTPEIPLKKIREYCGQYKSPTLINSIPIQIIAEDEELYIQWGILEKRAKLHYLGNDRFTAYQSGNNSGMQCNLVIKRHSNGEINGLSYEGHRVWNLFFEKI